MPPLPCAACCTQVQNVRIGVIDATAAADTAVPQVHMMRGVFSTADISTGDVMAAVPLRLALPVATDNLLVSCRVQGFGLTAV